MTDDVPSTAVDAQSASFRAEARAVGAGRGWDWLVEAFALFRRQPGMWILMVVVLGVLFVLMSMIPVLGSLASALLLPIFGAGLMLGCRALDREGTLEMTHLFAGFKEKTGNLVMIGVFNLVGWAAMAMAVIAVVGGGVVMGVMRGGSIGAGMSIVSVMIAGLLVAALSVPLYMATWFAPALIVLNDVAPMDALKASFFACLRNWIPFTVYSVVLLVLGLLAAIPLGLGYLVLVPVLAASIYTAYRDLFRAA
jgi:hypothetical protein